jgi:hypothetical protein
MVLPLAIGNGEGVGGEATPRMRQLITEMSYNALDEPVVGQTRVSVSFLRPGCTQDK